jgi:hypothetical protein
MLHERRSVPGAVINLDMVGEDARCGGRFIVERSPDLRPSLINPMAEEIVREVFAQTGGGTGVWQAIPFMGFSDHALFADAATPAPAVQFCHPADRFNHSAADTLDKVSPVEMLRSTAAAAALAYLHAWPNAVPASGIERLVQAWCSGEITAATQTAKKHEGIDRGRWSARVIEHAKRANDTKLALLGGGEKPSIGDEIGSDGPPVTRRWHGPVNIRAMLHDAPDDIRRAASNLIRADKRNYAMLLNFAIRIDGRRSRRAIIDDTSSSWRQPLDEEVAQRLFDVLLASEWAATEAAESLAAPLHR